MTGYVGYSNLKGKFQFVTYSMRCITLNLRQIPKAASLLCVLLILFGVAVPVAVYHGSLWDQEGAMVEGTPVIESAFSDYVADNRDSEIFPNAYKIRSSRPFLVSRDYSDFTPSITSEAAAGIAQDFLEKVGPSSLAWTVASIANMTDLPAWQVSFSHVDFLAYVIVDSVAGSIIEYESKYLHDFDPAPLSLTEAENLTREFLQEFDVMIPNTAHYIKGEPYDCQRFYSLVFQEYIGSIMVEGSSIVIRASAFTRGISYYSYDWIGIDDIDTSYVIDENVAKSNALSRYSVPSEYPEFDHENSILALTEVSLEGLGVYSRLSWVIRFETGPSKDATLFVDAFSGNLYGVRDALRSFEQLDELPTLGSSDFLLMLTVFSTASAVLLGLVGLWLYRKTGAVEE